MKFADEYLAKQGGSKKIIQDPPAENLKYIVVIPAYNESGLIESLDSLIKCKRPSFFVEVIIVINWPFNSEDKIIEGNLQIKKEAEIWAKERNEQSLVFHFILAEPENEKRSGVGFTRKTGMDEAILRFVQINQPDGIILSLDADIEVESNYFTEIENHFNTFPKADGCTVYFEHPLNQSTSDEIRQAIVQYELHQRYYLQALRFAGHPNSFHTVGSAFGVKAETYCLQGGMNLRKAGEDFYFLQKVFDLGNFTECNSTCIYPSPRPSLRVPFGTGPVIASYLKSKNYLQTFNFELFAILKDFLDISEKLYKYTSAEDFSFLDTLHPLMQNYLRTNAINHRLQEIFRNSSNEYSFLKRFFRWFNMFRMLKFLNFGKTDFHDLPVRDACIQLLERKGLKIENMDNEGLLNQMRKLEKNNSFNHLPPQ
jgi:hypothetical protein